MAEKPVIEPIVDRRPVILDRLAAGESLRAICRTEGFPTEGTVRLWAREEPFATQYAQAREAGYGRMADELLEIADDGTNDTYLVKARNGEDDEERVNHDHIARSRLRVDTRKWLLSKMLPKVYGDKVELSGKLNVSTHDLSDAELAAIATGGSAGASAA